MSIKRAKQRSFGSDKDSDDSGSFFAKPKEPVKSWEQHVDGKGDEAFAPYSMKTKFTKGSLIAHSKFGKGVVVDVDATNVQVLFQEGPKKLGHAAP